MKEFNKGKFDVKGDEGIFLGYSCRSKGYKFLNLTTHKIIESAHVRIDEFVEKSEEERKKELEDYKRFCHVNFDNLIKISKLQRVRGIPRLRKPDMGLRKNCQIGKMGKTSFKRKNYQSEDILEIVHIDLCGPIGVESYNGEKIIIFC